MRVARSISIGQLVVSLLVPMALLATACGRVGPRGVPAAVVLNVGAYHGEYSALIYIAQEKGYFRESGLSVRLVDQESGVSSLRALLAGEVDIGTAAEFPTVNSMARTDPVVVLACIGRGNTIQVVARTDRGILIPEDLRDKRIAVPLGTQAEFYLELYLAEHALRREDVTLIDTPPSRIIASLEGEDADAAIIWEPVVYELAKRLGSTVRSWSAQSDHEFYFLALTRPDVVLSRAGDLDRFIHALVKAERFAFDRSEEAERIVAESTGMDPEYLRAIWPRFRPTVFLSQGLVVTMETEAEWLLGRGQGSPGAMLDVLDFLYRSPLDKASPDADTIID